MCAFYRAFSNHNTPFCLFVCTPRYQSPAATLYGDATTIGMKNGTSSVMFPVLAVGATAVAGYGIYSFVQNRKKAQKAKEILDEMVG